jgi:4-hydroxy-tetrahydrodipicolinate synthase
MICQWRGVFPAVTTSFHADESLDIAGTLAHVTRLLSSGVHGLVMLGTVGENCSLDAAEKREVLREAVRHVGGRVPVLSGVAECTTRQACHFAADAERIGADGLMVLPAMVYKGDGRETMAHFRAVARSSGLPIMCYNNPPAYGVDITPEMFRELADEPTLVCIKESSENPRRITDIINATGDRYVLFAGVDDLALECLMLGAVGWVSGLVNAFPEENRQMWELIQAGRWAEALAVYRWYTPLLHLDTHGKLVQYIKMCMAVRGYGTEVTRAPRLAVVGEERDRVLGLIQGAMARRP